MFNDAGRTISLAALAVGWSMGAQALALMMERGGCGEGKKKDLKVEKSEGMQIPAGVEAHVIIPGIPE